MQMIPQMLHELHTTSSRFTASAESFALYLSVLYVEFAYGLIPYALRLSQQRGLMQQGL